MEVKKVDANASGSDMSTAQATWTYILPSLNYIMRGPTPDFKAPILSVAQHASIYTVVYNFATASRSGIAGIPGFGTTGATGLREGFDPELEATLDRFERVRAMIGYELYCLLDDYFRDLAREIRMNAPLPSQTALANAAAVSTAADAANKKNGKGKAKAAMSMALQQPLGDEVALVEYYVKAYARFSTGAAQINRIFAYLNRHFVLRAIDEGCGWISLGDVVAGSVLKDLAAVTISGPNGRKVAKRDRMPGNALVPSKKAKEDLKRLEARKHAEWRKWGYDASVPRETDAEKKLGEKQRRIAELCAESASTTERIITCSALAMRSWRLEVAEPLLSSLFWNTNGNKHAFIGTPPVPPTPLEPVDSGEIDGPPSASSSKPQTKVKGAANGTSKTLPPIFGTMQLTSQLDDSLDDKGKGKKNATPSLALSIPVTLSATAPDTHRGRNGTPTKSDGRTSGKSTPSTDGNEHLGEVNAKAVMPVVRTKRFVPRKGGPSGGGAKSLAEVRAATAAAAAAREAEAKGETVDTASESPFAQKSRLSRAVTVFLDAPFEPAAEEDEESLDGRHRTAEFEPRNGSGGVSGAAVKESYVRLLAESLMMSGISPDHGVRRRLDRFLSKTDGGLDYQPMAKW